MYNHAPTGYKNPFRDIVRGVESEDVYTKQQDIFYKDEDITAFISAAWWPRNPGGVLIISNEEVENLYDIDDALLSKINIFAKKVAVAMKKTYGCDGVSIRQHNEPAGNQEVWHYHLHVLPRYDGDDLYISYNQKRITEPKERLPYAEKLRKYFDQRINV